jgi:hypothetical protein
MTDIFEQAERLTRCEEEASSLFRIIVAPALARYHDDISLIPDPKHTPRFDRARAAAQRRYELISIPAWALRNRAVHDLMMTGEVSAEVDEAMTALRDSQRLAASNNAMPERRP